MSAYNPFGNPIVPGQGTPKFHSTERAPGFDQALGNARAAETAVPAGPVPTGALLPGIFQQPPQTPDRTLLAGFDKLTPADLERFETARRAMFQE
jgi:hypothetical protein